MRTRRSICQTVLTSSPPGPKDADLSLPQLIAASGVSKVQLGFVRMLLMILPGHSKYDCVSSRGFAVKDASTTQRYCGAL